MLHDGHGFERSFGTYSVIESRQVSEIMAMRVEVTVQSAETCPGHDGSGNRGDSVYARGRE